MKRFIIVAELAFDQAKPISKHSVLDTETGEKYGLIYDPAEMLYAFIDEAGVFEYMKELVQDHLDEIEESRHDMRMLMNPSLHPDDLPF